MNYVTINDSRTILTSNELTPLSNHEGCNKLTKLSIENGIKIFTQF